jgi:hypothetical protein
MAREPDDERIGMARRYKIPLLVAFLLMVAAPAALAQVQKATAKLEGDF